jgi:hypothetical protein
MSVSILWAVAFGDCAHAPDAHNTSAKGNETILQEMILRSLPTNSTLFIAFPFFHNSKPHEIQRPSGRKRTANEQDSYQAHYGNSPVRMFHCSWYSR